jgi:hypothetical protein
MGRQFVKHLFGGGWATDFGPSSDVVVDRASQINIPFLTKAENVIYELDGGPHKVEGTTKLNSSALESGAAIMGLVDYWIQGSTGTPTQHRVIAVGTKFKKDDADGTFSDIFTGKVSGAIPDFTIFDDILIISNDASADVPMSWDGTTAQNLAGSPPNFAFSTTHHSHVFAAGVVSSPSTLYYSVPFDPEDWTGTGSGSIQIDPNDGDKITAIISHKDTLIVFKGPYKGSIHIITGTSSANWDRQTFIDTIGAVNQRTTIPFKDDVLFMWSDGTVRSLTATQDFGDFRENTLSVAINRGYLNKSLTFNKLEKAQAVNDDNAGYVLITVPADGSSTNNVVLMMDYRFMTGETLPRWAKWSAYSNVACIVSVIDPTDSNRRIIMGGHDDGFVRKWGRSSRSLDGTTAINYDIATPFLNYATPSEMKTISGAAVSLAVKNDGNVTFGWTRDTMAQQAVDISQGGVSDVLGTVSTNQFTLGTSQLGGALFSEQFSALGEEGGEFRSIQYEITNAVVNEDVEIHGIGAFLSSGAESMEN